jgi:hypothetical protein
MPKGSMSRNGRELKEIHILTAYDWPLVTPLGILPTPYSVAGQPGRELLARAEEFGKEKPPGRPVRRALVGVDILSSINMARAPRNLPPPETWTMPFTIHK